MTLLDKRVVHSFIHSFIHSYPFRSRYFALIILLFLSLWNWGYPDWHDQDVYIKGTLDLRSCIWSFFLWNCNCAENGFWVMFNASKASNIKKMLKDWLLLFLRLLSISPNCFVNYERKNWRVGAFMLKVPNFILNVPNVSNVLPFSIFTNNNGLRSKLANYWT